MSDTIKTPDPAPDPSKKTINPPTSWVETKREPLPPETAATIVASSSVEEFPPEVRPFVLDANRQVNQYILVKVLGKGGMGEVWKAWDRRLSRWAAIKFLLGESQEGVARFKREAKMAARLSHPNIAPVHEVGEAAPRQPGQPSCHFLAMEYIDGSTLGNAKLSMRDRVDVFIKVAQGIDAAHRGGVVHRDIKPANIMLTKENWPYVMDFGLAKSLDGDNNLSATGAVMGTPAFMPPEQVEGKLEEIGPWSDVYSLGATMYAVFCGAHPFTAQTTLQLLQKVVNEAPVAPRQRNAEISPELESIILKALAKKKEDRYPSSGAVADILKKILARMDAGADAAPAPAPAPPTPRPSSALPLVASFLVLLMLGAGSAAVWWFKFRKPAEPVVAAGLTPEVKPENRTKPVTPPPDPKLDVKPDLPSVANDRPAKEGPAVVVPPAAEQVAQRGYAWLAARYRQTEFSTDADYWAAFALFLSPNAVPRQKIVQFLKSDGWLRSPRATSAAAARTLALAASGDPKLQELAAEGAQFLVETQGPNGHWALATEAPVRLDDPKPSDAFVISGDPARKRYRIVKKGGATKAPDGTPEVTSAVLAALRAAENCGHLVPAEVWTKTVLVVDPARPIASLSAQERAAALWASVDPEWYAAGAKALAASQQPDGSWNEGNDPVAATAQALIVLARGTASVQAGEKRVGAGRLEMKSIGGCANLMFVLDASGNMRQEMDGRERFDVAKTAISRIVEKLPEGSIAGLRVYGNRRLAVEPGAEVDSTLITPPGPVNPRQLVTHMQSIKVKGRSPLTYSLIQTAQDLAGVAPDVEMSVVLLIDGAEMERKADPVPATGDLAASRRGLKVHVVGFNTDDDDVQDRMRRMADAGGGRYIAARNEKDLLAQLTAATVGETEYSVLNDKGEVVAKGRMGDSRELPDGVYTIVCGPQQERIWIHAGQLTRVIVNQQKLLK